MSDYYPAVTDDYSADIVLQEIKEARAELDRLIELCRIKKAELDNRIAGLKIDLQYARMKAHQYGTLPMGGTKKLWETHWAWNSEVRRLETELLELGVTEF